MKKRNGRKIIACALAFVLMIGCLLYTSDAADDMQCAAHSGICRNGL